MSKSKKQPKLPPMTIIFGDPYIVEDGSKIKKNQLRTVEVEGGVKLVDYKGKTVWDGSDTLKLSGKYTTEQLYEILAFIESV